MNSQDLRALQEAYMEVVENQQLDEGMTMKDFKQQRSRQKQKEKRADAKTSPTRRAGIHKDSASPERAARHRVNVDPDFEGNDERNYPGGKLRPNKVRKAKALGELGEQVDLYDVILSHLLDEGYAETPEAAEAIMVNMSEEWRESIILEQSLPSNYTDYKSPAVQASHARSMGSASRMRQMGMNATSVDPKDDAQSNLNAVKSGNGVAKPLSGTTIKSGAGKGFKVGDPGIDIGPSK